jgi:hypothetical protein
VVVELEQASPYTNLMLRPYAGLISWCILWLLIFGDEEIHSSLSVKALDLTGLLRIGGRRGKSGCKLWTHNSLDPDYRFPINNIAFHPYQCICDIPVSRSLSSGAENGAADEGDDVEIKDN